MSTYSKITRSPATGQYELATWHDDYFGPHQYGVEFPSEKKVWPEDIVNEAQIEKFFVEDVANAFRQMSIDHYDEAADAAEVCLLFNEIQRQYKEGHK